MSKNLYINGNEPVVGRQYYLVEYSGNGDKTYRLHSDTPVTNLSNEKKERGFLGETDGRSRYSLGKITVLKSAQKGDPRNNKYHIKYSDS